MRWAGVGKDSRADPSRFKPQLFLSSCAALGRSTNLHVLQLPHLKKGVQISEAEFWHTMNFMRLLNWKRKQKSEERESQGT